MIYEGIDEWNPYFLEHHGVKGMKWGVRRELTRLLNGRPRKSRKQRRYERSDYAKAKSMSNQELQQRIARINLEQSYISAMQRDKAAYKDATSSVLMKTGRRAVRDIWNTFTGIGRSVATQSVRNAATNRIQKRFPSTVNPDQKKKKK